MSVLTANKNKMNTEIYIKSIPSTAQNWPLAMKTT